MALAGLALGTLVVGQTFLSHRLFDKNSAAWRGALRGVTVEHRITRRLALFKIANRLPRRIFGPIDHNHRRRGQKNQEYSGKDPDVTADFHSLTS